MYGNYQTLRNFLSGDTIRNYPLKREFGYEMTGWNMASDGLYQGIKIYYTRKFSLYAPFDCKITDINISEHKITLAKVTLNTGMTETVVQTVTRKYT